MVKVRLTKAGQDINIYLDTGYRVTLIDHQQLRKLLPGATLSKIALPLKVRGVGSSQHETSEYLITPTYLLGFNSKGNKVLTYVRREIYIVDGLRTNIVTEWNMMWS